MSRRRRVVAGLALVAAGARAALAQQKPARVVVLSRIPANQLQSFREGMRELGQVEGRSWILEERYAAGGAGAALRALAIEVAASRPAVILAWHGEAAQAAKSATATIPVVFSALDPVAEGLVASLARPGGNATGQSNAGGYEIAAKRAEILRDAVPASRRLAVLHTDAAGGLRALEAVRAAAPRLGFDVMPALTVTQASLGPAVEGLARAGADALMHTSAPTFRTWSDTLVALAARHRLPAIYEEAQTAEAGGLIGYGADRREGARRLASFVDRILRGARPADIPVEQMTRYELAINLRTARDLGLTIPPSLVALADRVIE